MSITTSCPGCKSLFRLPEELAGKQVRCQKCAELFEVPHLVAPEATPIPLALPVAPPAEVIEATLAEPAQTTVVQPPPLPNPAPPSVGWAIVGLLLFLLSLLGTGGFATLWVATHLAPPLRVSAAPAPKDGLAFNDRRFDFKKDEQFFPNDVHDLNMPDFNEKLAVPGEADTIPLALGFDGKARVQDANGAPRWYRLHLEQGQTYHFVITSRGVLPSLRLVHDQVVVAEGHPRGAGVLFVAYRANRTGAHLLQLTAVDGLEAVVVMNVARVTPGPAIPVDLSKQTSYTTDDALRIEDPLDPTRPDFGPHRDYVVSLLEGQDYQIKLSSTTYRPLMRIYDETRMPNGLLTERLILQAKMIDFTYRAQFTGRYRIRVSSEAHATGPYRLQITQKPVE